MLVWSLLRFPTYGSGKVGRFPTVIEGKVEDGRLVVTVHDVFHGTIAGQYAFS